MMPVSLKFFVPFLLFCFLVLQSGVVAYYGLKELDDNIERESLENLNLQMQHLQSTIAYLVKMGDEEKIQQLVATLGADPQIQTGILVDEKGIVIASFRLSQRGELFAEILHYRLGDVTARMKQLKHRFKGEVRLSHGRDYIDGFYPVVLGTSPGKILPDRIGMLIVEKEIASQKADARTHLADKLFPVMGQVFIITLMMWMFLYYGVTNRIMKLVRLAHSYSKGNYGERSTVGGKDEIAVLSEAFHEMAAQVSASREHLEEQVEKRTAELQEANQKLKELDRLKTMFIASMSHELRTPLNSIIGFTDVVLSRMIGELNEKQKDYLTRVSCSGKHLLRLITDVIDISKIEAGRIIPSIETFELKEAVEEVMKQGEVLIKEKPLNIVVQIPGGIIMDTDKRLLMQVLLNFLSNAIKYSELGDIVLSVHQPREGRVLIKICDQGIGIRAEDIPNLFKAFERFESHLKVIAGGSGLGLYLTKKIVEELLKGEVGVSSEYGVGSCFWLEIPIQISPVPVE